MCGSADDFETMLAFNMMVPPKVRAGLVGRPLNATAVMSKLTIPVLVTHGAPRHRLHPGKDAFVITTSKSKHQREAIIPLYDDLTAVLAAIPKRSTTILTNSKGRPWSAGGFGSSFIRAKTAAGLADANLHFHDLRGTAATRFYTAGLSERIIAEIMGWEEEHVAQIIRKYVGRAAATKALIAQLNERRT
jgi:integrase